MPTTLVWVLVLLTTALMPVAAGRAGGTLAVGQVLTPSCPGSQVPGSYDYHGLTLVKCNFSGADLSGANFKGATLTAVVFIRANLSGADFSGATIADSGNVAFATDFSFANLTNAKFVDTRFNGTTYLTYATLTCADFSHSNIDNTNAVFGDDPLVIDTAQDCRTKFQNTTMNCEFVAQWRSLDLTNAVVSACAADLLKGLDLSGAMMDGVSLFRANLQGVNFNRASLRGANLSFANLSGGATMVGAQLGVAPGAGGATPPTSLVGAYMPGVDLTDADLRSANLTGAHIYGDSRDSKFVRTRLDSADLSGAILSGAAFSGSLTNAVFNNAVLVNASFSGSDLTSAKFDSAYLQGADFSNATSIVGLSLNNAAVATAAGSWSFKEQDGTPFTFGFDATNLGSIASETGAFCPSNESSPCTGSKLVPSNTGPFPPQPPCVPKPPRYDNCLPPKPP